MDKLSYALGLSMGHNFLGSGIKSLNYEDFAEGVKAVYENTEKKMSFDEAKQVIQEYFTKLESEAAKKRYGVHVTESGLQYEIKKEGEGKSPEAKDSVTVHYTGTLIDGRVFDSSVQRGEPATFGVTQVIPAWVEALQMMKPGAEWRIYCPSHIAYGPNGAGGMIGPNETLIFDIQLIAVNRN